MLPSDLLVVKKRRGNIAPGYLREVTIAWEIINLFKEGEGEKYEKVLERCEELESAYDYRVVRGLRTIVERKCDFKLISDRGKEIRRFLFERGFITSEAERRKVLEEAQNFFRDPDIEELMFCDLKEEQLLCSVPEVSPEEIVKEYNLSLTQTLLFNALELSFTASDNYQEIFRRIKYLGLMYEIEGNEVRITGPASLFKKTRKYGTSFAKLLPPVIKAKEWHTKAKIELNRDRRVYDFELSSKEKDLFPVNDEEVVHFDSKVEENFYKDFLSFDLGWDIKREPAFIKAGNSVIIPDFGFYRKGIECYLEIVGFWTPEYLENKLRKLKGKKIIVAVNRDLSCKREDFDGNVLFYSNRIDVMPIAKILKRIEEESIEKESEEVRQKGIALSEDIVSVKELANKLDVSTETIRRLEIPGYTNVGDKIVSLSFLERLKGRIGEDYDEAMDILEEFDLGPLALDLMGYRVEWRGLKPVGIKKVE